MKNAVELLSLKPKDKVQWENGDRGTVAEVSYAAVSIRWDDGTSTLITVHDTQAIEAVSRA